MCLLSRLLLLGIWWGGQAVHAQPVFHIPPDRAIVALSQELEYFIDESGRWQPDSGDPAPGTWLKLRDRAGKANFGFVAHPVWFRVVLRSQAAQEWVWVISTPQLEWVMWVQQRAGSPPERSEAGLGPQQQQRTPPQRLPSTRLSLAAHEPVTVHMRVQSTGLMQVPVDLWEPAAWQERERRSHALLGAYFGLLAALLAYNGFLALRLRDQAYGHYLGFGLGLGGFQLTSTGFGQSFLWTSNALWTNTILGMTVAVFAAFTMLFTDSFLRLSRNSPRLHRLLRATALIWLLVLLLHLGLPASTVMNRVILPLALLSSALIMIAGVKGVLNKTPAAAYFLIGWTGLVVAALLRTLLRMGVVPPHALMYDGMLIASAAEMLLLSLALADRIMAERRAHAEADLQRAREQVAREEAQRALREKSGFMAAVAHDLQQPIYAMSLATESLARLQPTVPPGAVLLQMRSALHSADDLLASLAMATQLDRAELQPALGDFSVQDMLERIDDMFSPRAHQSQLRWRVLPSVAVVRSDPVLLERMVCNLVSNALRYTRHGGVLLSSRRRGNQLLIQVWDTGPGIAHDEHEAVFLLHHRGRSALGHDQGLGLGLALVKRCGDLLQIQVGLRSTMGRGSCFSLWVPLATAPGESA